MGANEFNETFKITGVVIPMGWNEAGQVISLGIAAADETNYLVFPGPGSERLKKMLQREVTIWGRIKGDQPGQTIIVEKVEMKKGKQSPKWSLVAVAMICAGLLVSGGMASAAQQADPKTKVEAEKPAKMTATKAKAKAKAKKMAVKPNAQIKSAQEALSKAGFKCAADGIMGKKTQTAVKGFQKKNKLKVTGKLDKATRAKLGV